MVQQGHRVETQQEGSGVNGSGPNTSSEVLFRALFLLILQAQVVAGTIHPPADVDVAATEYHEPAAIQMVRNEPDTGVFVSQSLFWCIEYTMQGCHLFAIVLRSLQARLCPGSISSQV